MKPRTRSITGAVLMLAIIPIFAGLLACMPVPIGDPERSRIDPAISGVWTVSLNDEEAALYLFWPYDERTWLLFGAEIDEGAGYAGEFPEIETHDDVVRVLREETIGYEGITATQAGIYKVWQTRLRGVSFLTWEPVGVISDAGSFSAEIWFVFRLDKDGENTFRLRMVDSDHDTFEDIVSPSDYEGDDYAKDMRRTWERALKRAIDDPELYTDDDIWVLRRLPPELTEEAAKLFQEFLEPY